MVKLFSFTHPQWHLIFGFNITIAPSYILNQIELEVKRYGLKHSIANLMDQPSCTLDATTVLKYNSQGRALLLLVSKQTWSPPFRASNTPKIVENRLEMRKLWPLKIKGVKKFKKKLLRPVLKHLESSFYVVFLLLEFECDF